MIKNRYVKKTDTPPVSKDPKENRFKQIREEAAEKRKKTESESPTSNKQPSRN